MTEMLARVAASSGIQIRGRRPDHIRAIDRIELNDQFSKILTGRHFESLAPFQLPASGTTPTNLRDRLELIVCPGRRERAEHIGDGRDERAVIERGVLRGVLSDLETFKLPAMRQAGVRFTSGGPTIALFAKSGFTSSLLDAIDGRENIALVGADQLVADLIAAATDG